VAAGTCHNCRRIICVCLSTDNLARARPGQRRRSFCSITSIRPGSDQGTASIGRLSRPIVMTPLISLVVLVLIFAVSSLGSRFGSLLAAGKLLKTASCSLGPPNPLLSRAGDGLLEAFSHLDESECWEECALCLASASDHLHKSSKVQGLSPCLVESLEEASKCLSRASQISGCIVQAAAASADIDCAGDALGRASSPDLRQAGLSLKELAAVLAK